MTEDGRGMSTREIHDRLATIKIHGANIYDEVLNKVEISWYRRLRKTARQIIRRYLARREKKFSNHTTAREFIRWMNAPLRKPTVVFVTGYPTFNLTAMSIGLRHTGDFETVLLTESPWLCDELRPYFDIVHVYDSYYSVAKILSAIRPYVIHVQGSISYYFFAILARTMSASPVVLGLYDIPSYGLTKDQWISMWGKTDTELDFFIEPYGFEAMDGVITSVHCIDAGKALHEKYESTVPMIEFLAYPCEEFIPTAGSKYSDEDGKIHLVYGGHVSPSNLPKEIFGDVQFHPLIDKITKQGMIFEMYPTPYMSPIRVKEIFADYINLAAANPLFKYYPDVSFKDALRQAARCDFGLMAYLFEKGCYGEDHTRWVIPTKFYKFIEVGLPIVVSEEVQHIAQLVREYDIGVVVSQKDLDNLVEILSAVDRRKLAANVRRARESMSVRRHIKSLVDFYAEAVDHRQKVMTSKLFGGG